MRFLRKLLKKLLSVSLALLIVLSSFLSFPQTALSQTQFSTARTSQAGETLLLAQASSVDQEKRGSFPDIQKHWARQYIEPLATLGVVVGYPDGKFKPDDPMTRTEFAAVINKAFNSSTKRPANNFVDVPRDYWGYSAIQTAYQRGFLEGYPDRRFQPGKNIPRVEVLLSLANGLGLQPEDIGVVSMYTDASQIPNYAIPAIAAATERQMVVNYPNLNQVTPNRTATRAEVAAFVYQALVYSGKSPIVGGGNPTNQGQQPGPYVVVVNPTVVPASQTGQPNGVRVSINNFPNVDGQSISVGQSITISTQARDPQGKDISSTIVWTNSNGQIVGKGSTLVFSSNESKIETLTATATASGNQSNNAKVTVAISPNDIITPPHVKPLPDETILGGGSDNPDGLIKDIEGIPGKICFTNDRRAWGQVKAMPTLRLGDVMLGASGMIPPVKILKVLPPQRDQSCVETEFAAIEEFFPKRKDGEPFDFDSLIADEDRIISFDPEGSDWVAINTSIPSNIGRPLPGIGRPPAGFNPREKVNVGPGVEWPSSSTGKMASRAPGTGPNIKSAKGWPDYLTRCVTEEYSRRYKLAEQKAVDKTFAQSTENKTTTLDYPFEPNIGRPPKPENIIPPEKYRFTFDLKSLLKEDEEKEPKPPIRTNPKEMNAAANRETSQPFKSTAKVEHKQELELLAYLGFNLKAEIPKNDRRFEGLDFKDYKSVIGFTKGDFFNFAMRIKIDEMLMGGIAMDGLYTLEAGKDIPIPTGFEGVSAYRIAFSVGPVPVWIDFPLVMNLKLLAEMKAGYREGVIGFLQNGYGDFTFNFSSGGSTSITNIDKKSIVGSNFCGRSDISGFAEARFQPRIQVLLYSLMGPELGIEPYARLKADHPQAVLSVTEPQQLPNQSVVEVSQDNEVRLTAIASNTVSIPLTASTGVDFAMTPAIVNEAIARRAPRKKVNIGKICLPEEVSETAGKAARWTAAAVTLGASEAVGAGEKIENATCIGPYNIDFDVNKYLRKKFTFRKNLVNKQKDLSVDIPIVEPFSRILQGLFENATLIWTSEKTGKSIAASNPGSPVTLDKCALPEGEQNLKVEAFSPFDSQLKQTLGKAYLPVKIKASEGCITR
jgi:hypothetical protein